MYPGAHAKTAPERPAVIMATSGETVTYRQLNDRSNQLCQLLWDRGVRPEGHLAVFMENNAWYHAVAWAALRSGLYLTAINSHLTADEVEYIVTDCGADVFVTSGPLGPVAAEVADRMPHVHTRLAIDGPVDGFEDYADAVAPYPAEPLDEELEGLFMLYSSGTTGRPKGIKHLIARTPIGEMAHPVLATLGGLFGFGEDSVYLSPAPLYHSAPLAFSTGVHRLGGTVVVMERFDPRHALELIERHRVTHSQWVPTMFVRMLKLPPEERTAHDLSSHRVAIHAAAPCPAPVKQQMIEWWGPIIHEYYAGTEGNGFVYCRSEDWLEHPGTVGRPLIGALHIVGDDGEELGPHEPGTIYFEGGGQFEYHNDPDKTEASRHPSGWSTLGDVGYLDEDGYLYLTDRKAYMIISGGVNIYPQECENLLITHPKVMDCAVFGVPNDEFGEEVKAVVQPVDATGAGPALERELIAFCKEHLASYKCPRTIDFEPELPRLPTGKLYKRLLRDRYWTGRESRIV
jgi:acyl-CoA synthetase (AMP-forming)/AMP-acid ligase II